MRYPKYQPNRITFHEVEISPEMAVVKALAQLGVADKPTAMEVNEAAAWALTSIAMSLTNLRVLND